MKKLTTLSLLLLCLTAHARADNGEMPKFSLMFHTGAEEPTGFIAATGPAPELGAWMGVSVSDRWDGFFAVDYFTMPNLPVTLSVPATIQVLPSASNSVTVVQPTDDVSLSVNMRWYPFNNKWDYVHQRYNTSFYLLGGAGADLVIDPPPPVQGTVVATQGIPLATNGYEILLGMNFGAGMDFPVGNGHEVSLYTEVLDHLIFWQNLTQVFDGRFGIRFMLDTAHADPFH
ncbi:MAG TPA: hypothetical protein VK791_07870 [bacterium]|jgi:hypothetical protein|nr:hypothetical protein [bacterium]